MHKIKRRRTGAVVPQRTNKQGYLVVDLEKQDGTKVKSVRVDELVWQTFHKRKLRMDETIEHIDGDKTNNKLENLKLVRKGSI